VELEKLRQAAKVHNENDYECAWEDQQRRS
jgi:hypothetical protein